MTAKKEKTPRRHGEKEKRETTKDTKGIGEWRVEK
jgi:hypothetical protein